MSNHPDEWTEYTKVSADELRLLHGGTHLEKHRAKAYVALAKFDEEQNYNLCSLPVHNGYDQLLPNFIESILSDVLNEDSYASLHSFFRPGRRYSQHPVLRDELGPDRIRIMEAYRDSQAIARLNACYVDIDYYKLGLTAGQVIGQIYDLQSEGKIPPPTYLKDSGRGLWVVWLLGLEPRSYDNQVTLWRSIQARLHCMFSPIGSDHSVSTNAAGISRIAGSVNSKANKRCNLVILARDNQGQATRYKLADLAASLGVEIEAKPKRIANPNAKLTNKAKGYKGQQARWELDEKRFWTLVEIIRRKVPVGTRNAHNLIIGSIIRHRHKPEDIRSAAEAASERLWKWYEIEVNKAEYTKAQVQREIEAAARGRSELSRIFAISIANYLRITTEEAEKLRDLTNSKRGKSWPPMEGQEPMLNTKLTRAQIRKIVTRLVTTDFRTFSGSDQALADEIYNTTGGIIKVSRELVRQIRNASKPTPPPPSYTQPAIPFEE